VSLIGIISNPSAGKDIRRLVSEAFGMDNRQKVNIVRRVLIGIEAVGVDEVAFMPDAFGIGALALERLTLRYPVSQLDMSFSATQEDSLKAASILRNRQADCIVVLGGDGTHRMVAKGCGLVPLVPISTGTNNVWPRQNEGTLAGLAAALVAQRVVPFEGTVMRTKRLEVLHNRCQTSAVKNSPADIALIDVAAYDIPLTGSRAVWEVEHLREIVLTTIEAGTVGLSSIGGGLPKPVDKDHAGLYMRIGSGGKRVLATIAPGMIRHVPIVDQRWLEPGESVSITSKPCVLALDGERERLVSESDEISIRLSRNGPRRVDVHKTLQAAADRGYFFPSLYPA